MLTTRPTLRRGEPAINGLWSSRRRRPAVELTSGATTSARSVALRDGQRGLANAGAGVDDQIVERRARVGDTRAQAFDSQ